MKRILAFLLLNLQILKNSLFYLFLFLPVLTFSQPGYLQFDKIDGGLNTLMVNTIYQDSKGWMWFGTSQGLLKYNGFRLELFKSKLEEQDALIGSAVRFIFEDSKGILWIGTDNGGLQRFDRETSKFKGFYDKDTSHKNIYYTANTLVEDNTGDLWLGTSQGLKKFNRNTGKFSSYAHIPSNPNSLCSNYVNKLYYGRDGKLWIATLEGLDYYNPLTNVFEHIPIFNRNDEDKSVNEIFEDAEGKIWIGTYTKGIFIIDPNTKSITPFAIENQDEFTRTVRTIIQDKMGNYWIGTRGGLYIYSSKTRKFKHFLHDEKNPLSLSHNSIISLFQNKQDDIWIGTRSGISYVISEKQSFRFIGTTTEPKQNLSDNNINTFWEDGDKNLWIGTDFGGINVLNRQNNSIQYINTNNGLSGNTIKSLTPDHDGNLWIGTYQGGLSVYNLKSKNIIKVYKHSTQDTGSLSDNKVWFSMVDSKGNLWIGTDKGLDQFDKNHKSFIHFKKHIINKAIDWIAEDSEHDLWIATNPNIFLYNSKNNSIRSFAVPSRSKAFLQDHSGRIWLGTKSNGLVLVDKQTLKIVRTYGEKEGIANNCVFSVLEDAKNTLWIGTANGMSRFIPESGKFKNYDKDDGTRITTYNYNASFKLSSGEFVFGGFNGLVIFNPGTITTNEYIPPVELTDFRIFNQPVIVGAKGSPLQKQISETKSITLRYDQNFISFRYIALNYSSPSKNKYAYKLEGVDKDWNYVGERKDANYTNLEPGKYVFKVKASNNDNQWNESGVSINIIIVPPFYKTWFFKISTTFVIILLTVIIIRRRIKIIKNRNKVLERLVDEKTRDLQQLAIELEESQSEVMAQNEEIEQQNEILTDLNEKINKQNEELKHYATDLESKVKERTAQLEEAKNKAEESEKLKTSILANMSHEIRTPMNSIVGLSNLMLQEELTSEEKKFFTLNIKRNSDILLHLINDLLDLSVIEAGKTQVHLDKVDITRLLKNIHEVFELDKQWLDKSHLEFKLSLPNTEPIITVTDKVKLEQIIRNLLHNAFKFTESGSIELGCRISVLDLIIYVKDSGIGIPPDKIESIFDRFVKLQDSKAKTDFGVGLGLAICSRLSEMLGGKIWVESTPYSGSTFYVSIPIQTEAPF